MRALPLIAVSLFAACAAPLEQMRLSESHEATSVSTSTRAGRERAEAESDQREAQAPPVAPAQGARQVKPFHISLRRGDERVENLRIIQFDPKHPERMWIDKAARKRIKDLLRDKRNARHKRIPERLLWYMYLVGQHFDAPLEIVSGYRSQERNTSRHRHMKAVDFRIAGVDPKVVWTWAKRFDNVGLGWYPTSKFVHLDVRKTSAYWIDDSGPGQRSRYRRGVPQTRAKVKRQIR